MFWMGAYPLLGEVGGGWALEFLSFLGPKWHLPIRSMPFPGPNTLPLPLVMNMHASKARGSINHRCINSYYTNQLDSKAFRPLKNHICGL